MPNDLRSQNYRFGCFGDFRGVRTTYFGGSRSQSYLLRGLDGVRATDCGVRTTDWPVDKSVLTESTLPIFDGRGVKATDFAESKLPIGLFWVRVIHRRSGDRQRSENREF